MLIIKRYPLKVSKKMLKRYRGFGYVCKDGDIIYVLPEEISDGSRTDIELLCDYCLSDGIETYLIRPYFKFINGRKNINKDACDKCKLRKTQEVLQVKYNVSHQSQLESVKKALGDAKRLKFSVVQKLFKEKDYLLISDESEYNNNASPLRFICPKHPEIGEQKICYGNLSQGQNCRACGLEIRNIKLRHNIEFIAKEFINRDYSLLNPTDYINAKSKLQYICNMHIDKGVQLIDYAHLQRGQGCYYCAIERLSGENCNFWQGGTTELNSYLRGKLDGWRRDSFKKDDYKCFLSGINKDLEIHHLYSFHKIVKESVAKFDLDIRMKVNEYSEEELRLIEDEFIQRHNNLLGVCLTKDIHDLFHNIYGIDNTEEQFTEFSIDFLSGKFNKISKIAIL